jgi:hypothetical protein
MNFMNWAKNAKIFAAKDRQIAHEKRILSLELEVSGLMEQNAKLKIQINQLTQDKRELQEKIAQNVYPPFSSNDLQFQNHSDAYVALN